MTHDIQLKDERIAALQRVHDLAQRFAEEAFPEAFPEEDEGDQT